eukprot:14963444-Alexandrium_andersonii.AAC.1
MLAATAIAVALYALSFGQVASSSAVALVQSGVRVHSSSLPLDKTIPDQAISLAARKKELGR